MRSRDRRDQALAGTVDCFGIDRSEAKRQLAFTRRHQHERGESMVFVGPVKHAANGGDIGRIDEGFASALDIFDHLEQHVRRELLPRFPAVERIRVAAHQKGARFRIGGAADDDGRGKIAPDGKDGLFLDPGEGEPRLRLGELEYALFRTGCVFAHERQGQRPSRFFADEP